jgi:nuclear pore complex protein Nup93
LASRGIDSDRLVQNLVDINLGLSFEPLQGVADTDIQAFLRNEHETLVSLAIEDTKSRAVTDFEGLKNLISKTKDNLKLPCKNLGKKRREK